MALIKNLLLDDKKPFWKFTDTELKDLDDQEDDCGYMWGQFGEAWYFVIMKDDTSLVHQGKKLEDV